MNLEEMKVCMNSIVQTVSQKYEGGEAFFTEVDAMIKNNLSLLISYYKLITKQYPEKLMILSGEIGGVYLKLKEQGFSCASPLVVVNGGLRTGSEIISIKKSPPDYEFQKRAKFIMIDDSYYSGKTVGKVREFLYKQGCTLEDVYVFYDGSRENNDSVKSLYRYYS